MSETFKIENAGVSLDTKRENRVRVWKLTGAIAWVGYFGVLQLFTKGWKDMEKSGIWSLH